METSLVVCSLRGAPGMLFRFFEGHLQGMDYTPEDFGDVLRDPSFFPRIASIILEDEFCQGRGTDWERGRKYQQALDICELVGNATPTLIRTEQWEAAYDLPADEPQRSARIHALAWERFPELKPTRSIARPLLIFHWWENLGGKG